MKSRREFFQKAGLIAAAASVVPQSVFSDAVNNGREKRKKRNLRIAHITDVHILDKPHAERYFSQVLKEINTLPERPDFIINTGDTVMDENRQTRETVEARWAAWNRVVNANNKLSIYSSLGNHDVWYGPNDKLDQEYKQDKRYGKQWAMDELKLPSRYYSFRNNGWHFIALDSINGMDGYQLDDEQFAWLKQELAAAGKTPVCVFSHVPILSMGALLYYTKRKPLKEVAFPSGDMHNDHQRIKDLFAAAGNVKLCLSGHVHYIDCIDYVGTRYLCNGAVSGNWWGSPLALDEFPPVYTIIDLYADGAMDYQYMFYKTQV